MKSNKIALALTTAAFIGLASCSADKTENKNASPQKLQEPNIVKSSGSISWNRFITSPENNLDLNDVIEFTKPLKGKLFASTTCLNNGQSIKAKAKINLKNQFQIFEFLDEEILRQMQTGQTLNCTFHFVVHFESGDQQVFGLQSIKVTDSENRHRIKVEKSATSSEPSNELVQIDSPKSDSVKMICTDLFSELNTSEKSISFSDLKLDSPQYYIDQASAMTRPGQVCRIISLWQNQITGISKSFYHVQKIGIPAVTVQAAEDWNQFRKMKKSFDPTYSVTKISNPYSHTILLKIPKVGPDFTFQVATKKVGDLLNIGPFGVSNLPGKSTFSIAEDASVISESKDAWIIELKPNNEIKVALRTRIQGYKCNDLVAQAGLAAHKAWLEVVEKVNGAEIHIPIIEISTSTPQELGEGAIEPFLKTRFREGKARCYRP